jgi:hypothetical protein
MSTSKPSVCFYCADQNPHRDRSLGITNYTYGLLRNLQQSGKLNLEAVVSKSSSGVPDGIPKVVLPFRTDHIPGRLLADHFHAIMVGRGIDAALWHYPKGFLPLGPQVRSPKIGTIADTILQFYADNYPQLRSRLGYGYWIAMLKNAVKHFDLILTVTEFSRRSILEFASRHQLKEPKVLVTYQGVAVERANTKPKGDYVLHLASTQPHKRTNWLLKEWHKLESSQVSRPKLLLIGQLDSETREIATQLKNTQVFPTTTREQVLEAISGALGLILPSEIEGFGLPALESYFSGTPVAYVKGTAVEEILGVDSPGGFRFEDGSLSAAMRQVLNMDRSEIDLKRTELQERFAWSKCVEHTLAAYRSVRF